MPRIQILQLPEGAGDERPPFILVIDQAPRDEALSLSFQQDLEQVNNLAERTGARAVVCFEDTIEIPSNDTSAYALGSVNEVHLDVQGDFPKFGPPTGGEPLTDPDRIPGRYA
ncbi:hypothetical protein [Streptomyces phaeochromogenes]|uniref:hypothetical protein n=1 Tax=Streptomyces phaeochromogenes TaxID=1923 RepID=UPI002DD8FC07|nr:hypothetical protein [Streptomyces phaeochromogenes]WRZ30188.1 hypothetical protein OG931_21780 [Streptomyces phaeochromogenes]